MGKANLAGRLRRIEEWARARFFERRHGPLARLFVRGSGGMTPDETLRFAARHIYWRLGRPFPEDMTAAQARELLNRLRDGVFHPRRTDEQ